jgi:hypothetical protein
MALYTVQVFKNLDVNPDRHWTNVYHVDAAGLDDAVLAVDPIVTGEVSFHRSNIVFSSARVSTTAEGDNTFTVVPLNENGGRGISSDQAIPLFNTVRVDIARSTAGRPDRKFYRLPICENDQANFILDSGLQSSIASAVDGMIAAVAALGSGQKLVGRLGGDWVSAVVAPAVQMRQLHRKRRRSS